MPRKKTILNERQQVVVETMRLKLTEQQSLVYLRSQGFDIHPATLYRDKNKIEQTKLSRLYQIAAAGFEDQHLETVEELKLLFKMLLHNIMRETDPTKQSNLIKDYVMLKPYQSAYNEATKMLVEKQPPIVIEGPKNKNESKQESNSISTYNGSELRTDNNINRKF